MEKAPTAEREAASRRRKGLFLVCVFFVVWSPASEKRGLKEETAREGKGVKEKKKPKSENSHRAHRESEGNALDAVEERQEGHGRELVAEGRQEGLEMGFFVSSFLQGEREVLRRSSSSCCRIFPI